MHIQMHDMLAINLTSHVRQGGWLIGHDTNMSEAVNKQMVGQERGTRKR